MKTHVDRLVEQARAARRERAEENWERAQANLARLAERLPSWYDALNPLLYPHPVSPVEFPSAGGAPLFWWEHEGRLKFAPTTAYVRERGDDWAVAVYVYGWGIDPAADRWGWRPVWSADWQDFQLRSEADRAAALGEVVEAAVRAARDTRRERARWREVGDTRCPLMDGRRCLWRSCPLWDAATRSCRLAGGWEVSVVTP